MNLAKGTINLESSDDLLTEILLRLPSKSLFKFTCVSTRWNTLIVDDFFRNLYRKRTRKSLACSYPHGRLLALVQSNNSRGACILNPYSAKHNFIPVSGEDIHGACFGSEFSPVERGYFITSSKDGFVLYGLIPEIYHVGNPITRRWETLPPPPPPEGFPFNSISVGLLSNEDDDGFGGRIINFRVIIATGGKDMLRFPQARGRDTIPIETYSSRTREWRRTGLISDVPVNIMFGTPPSLSGGFLHWETYTDNRSIVAFDPSSLDEEDNEDHCNKGSVPKMHTVHVIKTPQYSFSKVLWRSDNGQTMWFCCTGYDKGGVEVFRKRNNSDEWACISRVESEERMTKEILGITQKDIDEELAVSGVDPYDYKAHREGVWMMAFIPWNPRLVMMWYWDRVYVYDCIKMKLDHEVLLDGDRHYTDRAWEWTPYFHSLAESTLNLKHDHIIKKKQNNNRGF